MQILHLSYSATRRLITPYTKRFCITLLSTPRQSKNWRTFHFCPSSCLSNIQSKAEVGNLRLYLPAVGRHHVIQADMRFKAWNFYLQHSQRCFEFFFGPLTDYHFLALLPSYLERNGSSLIAMMDHFISKSQSPYSAFYLHEVEKLVKDLGAYPRG